MSLYKVLRHRTAYLQECSRIQALQVYGRTCDSLASFQDRVMSMKRDGVHPSRIGQWKRQQRAYQHLQAPTCFCEFISSSNDLDTAVELLACASQYGLCDCGQPPAGNLQPLQ